MAIIAALILVWSAVSRPLDRRGVTSALFFTAAGATVVALWPSAVDLDIDTLGAEHVAEVALCLLLFSDATRLDLATLRREAGWPARLLLIGLPLAMIAGAAAGFLLFPDLPLAAVLLLATMLAPTDAALGRKVVSDEAVPPRVRQALDVESGLNDGLAVPFFLVALTYAESAGTGGVAAAVLTNMAQQIGWGVLAAAIAGFGGGALYRVADRRGWIAHDWRYVLPLAAALLAFAIASVLGGSVFIAAFVAGLAFGRVVGPHRSGVGVLAEEAGELFASATWIAFGGLALVLTGPHLTWQVIAYAILSLTLVRMIPVALSLIRSGARIPTVLFIGWFGPRGLASLVFLLIASESAFPGSDTVRTTVVVTVAASVLLHGLTSVPLVARYSAWYSARTPRGESAPAALPRPRRAQSG
ncbi:cation:proton antiporter [Microbacterium sp. ZXX196]|uniref:cation:proton antiporter domain-containing protein n=1 Tax=Microbacterium sp. ZXX196 TaxID=2609291 RepID=UPI0013233FEF|nr:sodium:proton antiporter [Microbacterium sp. ZXX196]